MPLNSVLRYCGDEYLRHVYYGIYGIHILTKRVRETSRLSDIYVYMTESGILCRQQTMFEKLIIYVINITDVPGSLPLYHVSSTPIQPQVSSALLIFATSGYSWQRGIPHGQHHAVTLSDISGDPDASQCRILTLPRLSAPALVRIRLQDVHAGQHPGFPSIGHTPSFPYVSVIPYSTSHAMMRA